MQGFEMQEFPLLTVVKQLTETNNEETKPDHFCNFLFLSSSSAAQRFIDWLILHLTGTTWINLQLKNCKLIFQRLPFDCSPKIFEINLLGQRCLVHKKKPGNAERCGKLRSLSPTRMLLKLHSSVPPVSSMSLAR